MTRFRELVRERIPLAARFTCRVREVPLGLDRPLWVEDPDFDVDNHMHRVALPSPGGPRELGDLVGDLMSHQLDRRMPLWEMWFIEGLEGGNVAVLAKTHHSLMDGASGQGLAEHMFDLEPNPEPKQQQAPPLHKAERSPSDVELMARGLVPTMSTPFTMSRWMLQLSRRGVAVLPFLRSERRAPTPMDAPSTPWSGRLSARRRLSFVSVPLDEVKAIRKGLDVDVKINDVLLALVCGALREYLLEVDALPDKPLVCGVPLSTREDDDTELGNKIANMFVALPVQLEDPLERLRAIHESTMNAKEMTKALRARRIQAIAESAPPAIINLAFRTMFSAELDRVFPAAANVLVSNLPGPPIPLYSAGARVRAIYPIGPLMMGMGLNFTVMSYIDSVDFGLQCDPMMIPDPWAISDRIPDALAELKKASSPQAPTTPAQPAKRAKPARPAKAPTAAKATKTTKTIKAAG